MKSIILLFVLLNTYGALSQTDSFVLNGFSISISNFIEKNEWGTVDTLKRLFLMKDGMKEELLSYYVYQNKGMDCNNVFWMKETFLIKKDSIIINTNFYQKTGLDPIPEKRKQVYLLDSDGKLSLIYDKYLYKGSHNWTDF